MADKRITEYLKRFGEELWDAKESVTYAQRAAQIIWLHAVGYEKIIEEGEPPIEIPPDKDAWKILLDRVDGPVGALAKQDIGGKTLAEKLDESDVFHINDAAENATKAVSS